MDQVLCHDEYKYESPITPTGKKRMHQVLCHEYDESPFRHDEYENPITSTGKVWHQKQRGVTRGTEKEKYITKLLRVALKKEKIYYRSVCFQTLFISL